MAAVKTLARQVRVREKKFFILLSPVYVRSFFSESEPRCEQGRWCALKELRLLDHGQLFQDFVLG
jgi:hypothetical protein